MRLLTRFHVFISSRVFLLEDDSGQELDLKMEKSNEQVSLDDVFSLAYEELRRSAASLRRREMRETITTTALVHESWFKLKDSPRLANLPYDHFKSVAIRAMRQVLVEEARHRMAIKRDCELLPIANDFIVAAKGFDCVEFLAMETALSELEMQSCRQADVVCRRVFGGETTAEIAHSLGVSTSSVERDWRVARAWLATRMKHGKKEV